LVLAIYILALAVVQEEIVFACYTGSSYYVYCVAEGGYLGADADFGEVALVAGETKTLIYSVWHLAIRN